MYAEVVQRPAIASWDASPRSFEALRQLMDRRIAVDFHGRSIVDVVAALRAATGANIVLDPDLAASAASPRCTFSSASITLGEALQVLTMLDGYHAVSQDGAIYISAKQLPEPLVLRMYDVLDLTKPGLGTSGAEPINPQQVIDLITSTISPESWREDGVGIDPRSGSTLFLNQSHAVHSQVNLLMAILRQARLQP
jgi:hypothetical protein